MNRAGRRAFQKKYHKTMRDHAVDRLNELTGDDENWIKEGDRVRLHVDQIIAREDYEEMQQEYRDFIESNRETIFTAHLYRRRRDGFSAVVELEEAPKWLFWFGDLIRVEDGG